MAGIFAAKMRKRRKVIENSFSAFACARRIKLSLSYPDKPEQNPPRSHEGTKQCMPWAFD
jgi:hypothetical protein